VFTSGLTMFSLKTANRKISSVTHTGELSRSFELMAFSQRLCVCLERGTSTITCSARCLNSDDFECNYGSLGRSFESQKLLLGIL
jgi:hypothetical protein